MRGLSTKTPESVTTAPEAASRALARLELARLASRAVILDRRGVIRAANAAWLESLSRNGGTENACGVGVNYLEVCRRSAKRQSCGAAEMAAAIESALGGRQAIFEMAYECSSMDRQAWFNARVRAVEIDSDIAVFIAHDDVTMPRLLQQLVTDPSSHERERIASDLHEGVAQDLAGASLLLAGVLGSSHSLSPMVHDDITSVVSILQKSMVECRSIAATVSPAAGARGGLIAALRMVCRSFAQHTSVAILFDAQDLDGVVDDFTADHLYRIAQEAITNAIKHGRARSISVAIRERHRQLSVRIKDDGIGMPAAPPQAGMGLQIMRHRAALIGAVLDVSRLHQRGTLVSVTIPRHR